MDDDLKPVNYQMMVHLFGATSSPSCCSCILRCCADNNAINASLETVLAVKRSFCVDDMLHSVKSVDGAVKLITELTELLESGGFQSNQIFRYTRFITPKRVTSLQGPISASLRL